LVRRYVVIQVEERNMKSLIAMVAVSIASWSTPTIGLADGAKPVECIDADVSRSSIIAHGGGWDQLTSGQWQFLRGVFAMNPNTPIGLPFGDSAALAQVDGNAGGLVFFIDGNRACTPMVLPHELVDVLRDIAGGKIEHEMAGL
jgi:hypothetical protein